MLLVSAKASELEIILKRESTVNKKTAKIITGIAVLAFVLIIAVLLIEELGTGTVKVINNTDKNITALELYFEDIDGYDIGVEDLYHDSLAAGETVEREIGEIDLRYTGANVGMLITFEDEARIYAFGGTFNSVFKGDFEFEFYMKDGDYYLHSEARSGLLGSKDEYDMDDDIRFDFENADWEYDYLIAD